MKSHVNLYHNKNKNVALKKFLCQNCGKSFKTLSALNLHTTAVHKDPNDKLSMFQCQMCDRKYQSSNSLRFHVKSYHESEPQTCSHCGKLLSSSEALQRYGPSINYFKNTQKWFSVSSSSSSGISKLYMKVKNSNVMCAIKSWNRPTHSK